MPKRDWARLDTLPHWVILATGILAIPPILAWQAHPKPTGYPDAIATVVGILLTAVVFMLSAAQDAHQKALDAVVSEFSARDKQLCDAGASDDPEPWPEEADRERQHLETVVGMAALLPGERRWRRRSKQRRESAEWRAEELRMQAGARVRAALSDGSGTQTNMEQAGHERADGGPAEPDTQAIEECVDKGLRPGYEEFLPKAVRDSWDWKSASRDYQRQLECIRELDKRYDSMLFSAVRRVGVEWPTFFLRERTLSPLAVEFEDVLAAQLRPLETAYVLVAAMLSLTAIGVVYSRDTLSWPLPPALLAAGTIVAVVIIYIGFVRRSMVGAGEATGRRMMRLTLPALHHAAVLLEDRFVEQDEPTHRERVEKKLREYFTCLPSAADLPLRHRLLGQYHLARAWKELPVLHLRRSPRMGDFASLATMKPADVPAGIRGDARVVMRELAVACHHLERAVARRHDDPLAYLALAAALDARAAAIGEPADPEVSERVAEAFRSTTGPELADRGWWVQLKDHRWLWPREPGRLAELAHGIDT